MTGAQPVALALGDTPGLPLRLRTPQATLDRNYALLSLPEQVIFRRLGVFAGGFTLEAVKAIAATSDVDADLLDVMQGLVDKHLVRAAASAGCEPRFSLLATVRDDSVDRLVDNGEADQYRSRHFTSYLALAEETDQAMLTEEEIPGPPGPDHEIDNLRLAHHWATVHGDREAAWRFVAALWSFWMLRGALQEGQGWSAAAQARGCDVPVGRLRESGAGGSGVHERVEGWAPALI